MNIKKLIPGLGVSALVAAVSVMIQKLDFISKLNVSSLIIAIIIGALIKNIIRVPDCMEDGIKFSSKKILRLAIIMLGFKLNLMDIKNLGIGPVILIIVVSTATMIFVRFIGKLMNIKGSLSTLIAGGISICGAAAVAAVNGIIKADEEEVAYSIGVVTIFGTIFMFLYPILFKLLNLNTVFYSIWTGSSIHEVAQVVAAGFAVSSEVGTAATLVKLTRVLYIIPVTIILSITAANGKSNGKFSLRNISIPWFVIMFIGVVAINSIFKIDKETISYLVKADNYLMTAAMAALGLGLSFKDMKNVGMKPMYLGIIGSGFISIFSFIMIKLFRLA